MKRILFLLTIVLLAAGCMGGQQKESVRGTVEDGVYRNDFFGFTMDVPEGMWVMPLASMENLSGTTVQGAGHTDVLLFVSADDPSTVPDSLFNYNIAVTAEKLSKATNNEQYMTQVIRMLHDAARLSQDDLSVERLSLGGREYMKLSILSASFSQDIYARVQDGYALTIVGSYNGHEQREIIAGILATIASVGDR